MTLKTSNIQPNASLIKLAVSTEIVLVLFIYTFQLTYAISTNGPRHAATYLDSTNVLLENPYIKVTIFHELDLYDAHLFIICEAY